MEQKKLFKILSLSSLFITYSPESNFCNGGMFGEWLQFPINFFLPFLLRKYKTQRNKVNNMIKYAREQFFINANDMLDKNGELNPK
jgi:hypothetical protein